MKNSQNCYNQFPLLGFLSCISILVSDCFSLNIANTYSRLFAILRMLKGILHFLFSLRVHLDNKFDKVVFLQNVASLQNLLCLIGSCSNSIGNIIPCYYCFKLGDDLSISVSPFFFCAYHFNYFI